MLKEITKNESLVYTKIVDKKWRQDRLKSFETIRMQVEKVSSCTDVFCERILDRENQIAYLTFLDETAEKRNVFIKVVVGKVDSTSVKNKKVKEEEKKEIDYGSTIEPFDLSVQVLGSYKDIFLFLSDIENAPIVIHFSSLSIALAEEDAFKKSALTGKENIAFDVDSEKTNEKIDAIKFDVVADMKLRTYIRKSVETPKEK